MPSPFDVLDAESRAKLRKARHPTWMQPMLATLTADYFSDPEWIYELKLDGIRGLALRKGARARLLSRNQLDLAARYPAIVSALLKQPSQDFVVDGEIVAFEGKLESFGRLQGGGSSDATLARTAGVPIYYCVFDLLHLDGFDTTALPLRARKELLRRALRFRDPLRFSEHRPERGLEYLKEACREGWEGLIAKRAEAPYVPKRSRDWLKFKCVNQQELVIGGYTDPRGARSGFGALLVGYWERGKLRYAGKVGTGFDARMLDELAARLKRLKRATSPFADAPRMRDAHWAEPKLVGEVAFTEWTSDGRLRHPSFLGLRTDKASREVRRERPKRVR